MNEIKCPKCGTMFRINETDYENITKQIRDKEFESELERIHKEHEKNLKQEIELTKINTEKELNNHEIDFIVELIMEWIRREYERNKMS